MGDFELQKAIHAALIADATLMSMIIGVFDSVPQAGAFPFVTVGDITSTDESTAGKNGQAHDVTINVFSRYRGGKESRDIMARIYSLLHRTALQVAGSQSIAIHYRMSMVVLEADGVTYHGISRYAAHTLEA